jgi:hypothetical protein
VSDSARSPLSGCLILIAALCMLLFLIGFSIWVPFRQAAAIEKFTKAEPAPVPVADIESDPAPATGLAERLELFRSELADEKDPARVDLSAEDLNLAIASFPQLAELRGALHVTSISDGRIHADICYTLNGRPRLAKDGEAGPITSDPRYLVGRLAVTPFLSKRELSLRVESLDVPGSEVDEGFLGHFSTLRIFEKYLTDPVIGDTMGKLTAATVDGDKLVLARVPGDPVPDVVTDEQFSKGGSRVVMFVGGAMLLFLILAGTVLFLGYRAQLRKIQEKESTNPPADAD